jgi:hypothetical protein
MANVYEVGAVVYYRSSPYHSRTGEVIEVSGERCRVRWTHETLASTGKTLPMTRNLRTWVHHSKLRPVVAA